MHRAHQRYPAALDPEAVVREHAPLLDRVSRRVAARFGQPGLASDLWSAGALGLLDAARRFERDRGVCFETFAEHRVRGAMLDEVRRMDHLPRRLRAETQRVTQSHRQLRQRLGRAASSDEVASALGVTADEVREAEALAQPLVPLDDLDGPSLAPSPEEHASSSERRDQIASAVQGLPERLQQVLGLIYLECFTYREVAAMLKVSEPRVCQLHADAVARLRGLLAPPAAPAEARP